MKLKKLFKINKRLSDEFVVVPTSLDDGWRLVRTIGQRELLNSKTSTEKELKKFVKEHSFCNIMDVFTNGILITNSIGLLLSLANTVFIHSTFLSGIVSGMLLLIIPALITLWVVDEKNSKTREIILKENKEETNRMAKELMQLMAKIDKDIEKRKSESEKKEKENKKTTSKTTKSKTTKTKKEKVEVKAKSITTTPRKRASKKGEEKKD